MLELADELGNVSAACPQMGISRTRYYEWRAVVARLAALTPQWVRRGGSRADGGRDRQA
jgi:hypothetical protein